MDMKEWLVELLTDCKAKGFWSYGKDCKTGEHGGHEMTAEDIADYLAENIASKWISVKDRLPEYRERVIACGANGGVFMARATTTPGFGKVDGTSKYRTFNYWMPLPQLPKGE